MPTYRIRGTNMIFQGKKSSKYKPHQGAQEIARRLRQAAALVDKATRRELALQSPNGTQLRRVGTIGHVNTLGVAQ